MQRKVKKGYGRVRNMPVKDLKHLVTNYNKCSYITAGKLYPVVQGMCSSVLWVVCDDGRQITAPINGTSAHFKNIGRWEHSFK